MYILWDWNGTRLDDTETCLAALNDMLAARRLPTIGLDYFKDHFAFPARRFYEELGIRATGPEWQALAQEFHDRYHSRTPRLNAEARDVLGRLHADKIGQSVISALRQDLLSRDTAAFGLTDFFDHVYGVDNLDGGTKVARALELKALLEKERGREPLVVIGDSLHDKEVADALGARCVLFGGGSHSLARLAAVAPAFNSLADCVSCALEG